jgi:LPS O-antigen subunit length determinant protein (WzzB/FepE family)
MKSLVMKSIYAGLGLLGTGKDSVAQLGRKLAKQVNVSEKDGAKIARQLRARSEKAISALQKTFDAEVNRVVHALHVATRDDVEALTKKKTHAAPGVKRRARAKKRTGNSPKTAASATH